MALSGFHAVVKSLLFMINLIFWITGLCITALAVWLLSDPSFYISMAQDELSYKTGLFIFLGIGILLFIIGFLGCCGALRESKVMLVLFFCILLLLMVIEISAAAWTYANINELEEIVKDSVEETIRNEYGQVSARTVAFDAIQEGLACCGSDGPTDWEVSAYNNQTEKALYISASSKPYRIPTSCCNAEAPAVDCTAATLVHPTLSISPVINQSGCKDKLLELLSEYVHLSIIVGVVIGIIQGVGLLFALILCCGIQRQTRYKAVRVG